MYLLLLDFADVLNYKKKIHGYSQLKWLVSAGKECETVSSVFTIYCMLCKYSVKGKRKPFSSEEKKYWINPESDIR